MVEQLNSSFVADSAPCLRRRLTPRQIAAVGEAMKLFIEDDVRKGITHEQRIYCEACEQPRPLAGAISYGHYLFCNACATEFEVAQTGGLALSAGQFVDDMRSCEAPVYTLA